jgi:4,5-DOPA dioxygenase extradiol
MALPVLFVSHGSPLFALNPGTTGPALEAWARARAPASQLKGILLMSPHWMTQGLSVMSGASPETWHDFGGFPPEMYELQYPAPGSPALARQVQQLLEPLGVQALADGQRPFDHGTWVPLMHLYPQAGVPVVQLSLPAAASPEQLHALGQALAPLREQGILIVGSGSMTHNLYELRRLPGPPEPYVLDFCRWIEQTLHAHDAQTLFDYRQRAPHAERAHPTDEHFVTLYFALGAAGWGLRPDVVIEYISREVVYRTAAMDAISLS